jgi:hypothetical protein
MKTDQESLTFRKRYGIYCDLKNIPKFFRDRRGIFKTWGVFKSTHGKNLNRIFCYAFQAPLKKFFI